MAKKGPAPSPIPPLKKPKYPRRLTEAKKMVPWWQPLKLNPQEVQFVAEYISNGCNASDAYRKCSTLSNNKFAGQRGALMLKSSKVREAIREYVNRYLEERKADLDKKIIDVLTQQAFYDPADFIDVKGAPMFDTWGQVPKEKRCCIVGIDTKCFGKDADREITTIKLVDRHVAIRALTDFIQLGRPKKIELTGKDGGPIKNANVNVNGDVTDSMKKMTDAQLVAMLADFKE